eukprot:CAMPEP_0170608418 /NCGR_PEP_ID=MMETSP0224-20130122/21573_1 /TAXON_ID=285029 /ORGANISM="Togula jolla, Strain CCCM 725" /LENGTH=365 /DNA_ID=CAMNT_0010933641 /DNA_START=201 /DNA_END=1297 /DNA_ORIENTATION=-
MRTAAASNVQQGTRHGSPSPMASTSASSALASTGGRACTSPSSGAVELDRFTPDQMVQMAVGGNGKAWNFFKSHGMGKTSDTGRTIDYSSKITQRYRVDLDKEAMLTCEKHSIPYKQQAAAATPATPVSAPADEADESDASPTQELPHRSVSAPAVAVPAAPKPAAVPSTTSKVVRKAPAETMASSTASSAPKSGGAAAGAKAKQMAFDFDFDELESEANAPKPVPPPPAAPADTSAEPPVAASPVSPVSPAPARYKSEPSDVGSKYANKKAISSTDFFGDLEAETASAQQEREQRYSKFSGSGAISSSAFFSDGGPDSGMPRQNSGDDWKASASGAASRGSDMARAGISKGAEMLSTYLSKARD